MKIGVKFGIPEKTTAATPSILRHVRLEIRSIGAIKEAASIDKRGRCRRQPSRVEGRQDKMAPRFAKGVRHPLRQG